MIIKEHDLEPEDLSKFNFTSNYSEIDFDEEIIEWIETAAYYLWLQEGKPDDKHLIHWDQACQLYLDSRD